MLMLHSYITGDVGILYFSALGFLLLGRHYLNTLDQNCGLGRCMPAGFDNGGHRPAID